MSRARDVVEVVARVLADQPEAVSVKERESRGDAPRRATSTNGNPEKARCVTGGAVI